MRAHSRLKDGVASLADVAGIHVSRAEDHRCQPIGSRAPRSTIRPEYKKYADQVPAILARYGGKVLARGGRFQIMEGPQTFQRFVVIEFPTFEQGVACFTSDEYNKAVAFRRGGAGEVETVILDGFEAPR
jgi:uncharacterized protein (DUF1330 family)